MLKSHHSATCEGHSAPEPCFACHLQHQIRRAKAGQLLGRQPVIQRTVLTRLPRLNFDLPVELERKLRRLAHDDLSCEDLDRLYPSPENLSRHQDPRIDHHLANCLRCREIFSRLALAFSVARPVPSDAQLDRWRAIARPSVATPPKLPVWLRDTRFSVAASFVITVLLLLPLIGSSDNALRLSGSTVREAGQWIESKKKESYTERKRASGKTRSDPEASQSTKIWSGLHASLNSKYEKSRASLEVHGRSYAKLYKRTLDLFGLDLNHETFKDRLKHQNREKPSLDLQGLQSPDWNLQGEHHGRKA